MTTLPPARPRRSSSTATRSTAPRAAKASTRTRPAATPARICTVAAEDGITIEEQRRRVEDFAGHPLEWPPIRREIRRG
jgi:hypothetical protein